MLQDILSGVRVIDLTQNVAGPYSTQILGDMGATVVKVERPGTGDDTRQWSKPNVAGVSSSFLSLNRNKASVCVDVSSPEGCGVVKDLAASADVLIHSLKPGAAERYGFGYDSLAEGNERLVYCAISAFGGKGPLSQLPGYDPLVQAFTGIMSATGNEGDDPVRVGVSLIDMGTGLWAALGVMAALYKRNETGKGMMVEASLMDTGLSWMTIVIAGYLASGELPKKMGSGMAMTAPYELFRSADGYAFVAAANDRLFANVCRGLGCPELAQDPRFGSNVQRVQNRAALHEELERRTRKLETSEIVSRLRAVGAPSSEMNDVSQIVDHPQVQAAGIMGLLPFEGASTHRVVNTPLKLAGERGRLDSLPTQLGADTDRILAEIGYDSQKIAKLRKTGAIA